MTLGPIMMDLSATELTRDEADILKHPLVGGVILFSRNYESPEQLRSLTHAVHKLRTPRLLLAVDHEGGRVQRFREGFTRLPAVNNLGKIYDHDRQRAKLLAEDCGWLMAVELRSVGIDFSFAPVLDIDRGMNEVIGDRAFHSNPEIIADLAHSYMIGMNRAGMQAVGKHFPGHGGTAVDTHTAVAEDVRRYEDIHADDILPFERMTHFGLAGIMTAHIKYPEVDPDIATFSSFWLNEVLRNRLSFEGVVFSDDLSMDATRMYGDITERVNRALHAGCDMSLICNNPDDVIAVIDNIGEYKNATSSMRLVRLHGREHVTRDQLTRNPHWKRVVKNLSNIDESQA